MEWKLLGVSFVTIFLAELGDKSQIAAIALGGSSKHPKAVFLGTSAALLLASLLGVLAGEGAAEFLPARWLKGAAALGFAVLALRLLFFGEEAEEAEEAEGAGAGGGGEGREEAGEGLE